MHRLQSFLPSLLSPLSTSASRSSSRSVNLLLQRCRASSTSFRSSSSSSSSLLQSVSSSFPSSQLSSAVSRVTGATFLRSSPHASLFRRSVSSSASPPAGDGKKGGSATSGGGSKPAPEETDAPFEEVVIDEPFVAKFSRCEILAGADVKRERGGAAFSAAWRDSRACTRRAEGGLTRVCRQGRGCLLSVYRLPTSDISALSMH